MKRQVNRFLENSQIYHLVSALIAPKTIPKTVKISIIHTTTIVVFWKVDFSFHFIITTLLNQFFLLDTVLTHSTLCTRTSANKKAELISSIKLFQLFQKLLEAFVLYEKKKNH
jgi:hypothetical protein